jgi:hypothetical protein
MSAPPQFFSALSLPRALGEARPWFTSRSRAVLVWIVLLCGLLAGMAQPVSAQAPFDSLRASVALFGAAGSDGDLPFWLATNQHGTVDPTSANAGARLGLHRPFVETSGFDYAFGATLLGRASRHGTATVHELYGRLQYWRLRLTVGRKEQSVGRVDTSLSIGSVTRSQNASPLPRVSVSSDGYVGVPGTGDGLALKGYFAYGRLESDRFVEDALVHEKHLYARLLPPDFPVNAYAGVTHHVQWGGTSPLVGPRDASLGQGIDVAVGGDVFARGDFDSSIDAVGANHLAMYDFSLSVDLGELRGLAYRQFYHEDTASFRFRNPWDGLWGVSLRRDDSEALVTGILWEHLRMTRHNAKFSEGQERGADSYYNHSIYSGGWTYQGRTLGNPFLTTASMTPGFDDSIPGITNNIVVAQHLGLEGHLGAGLSYKLLGTYSRNYGAQNVCQTSACTSQSDERTDRRDQWSFRLDVSGPLSQQHNLQFRVSAALDTGEFYEERVGGSFALLWRGPMGR